MKLRVWWIPQVPSSSQFLVDVDSIGEGVKAINTLAAYDEYQYEQSIKPDYSNAGGLQMLDEDGDWIDWYDEETGEDDPEQFLADGGAV